MHWVEEMEGEVSHCLLSLQRICWPSRSFHLGSGGVGGWCVFLFVSRNIICGFQPACFLNKKDLNWKYAGCIGSLFATPKFSSAKGIQIFLCSRKIELIFWVLMKKENSVSVKPVGGGVNCQDARGGRKLRAELSGWARGGAVTQPTRVLFLWDAPQPPQP